MEKIYLNKKKQWKKKKKQNKLEFPNTLVAKLPTKE